MAVEMSKKDRIKDLTSKIAFNTDMGNRHSELALYNAGLPREKKWSTQQTSDTCAISHSYFEKAKKLQEELDELTGKKKTTNNNGESSAPAQRGWSFLGFHFGG